MNEDGGIYIIWFTTSHGRRYLNQPSCFLLLHLHTHTLYLCL
ncbi:unnamed protein product [Brassica oleracea var. botrytis]